jgi:hypothetical protein
MLRFDLLALLAVFLRCGTSAAQGLPATKQAAAIVQRIRGEQLIRRVRKEEQASAAKVRWAAPRLIQRGLMDADLPVYVEGESRRLMLASLAREYRLLRGAEPNTWASARRAALQPVVGTREALEQHTSGSPAEDGAFTVFHGEPGHYGLERVVVMGDHARENLLNMLAHEQRHVRDLPRINAWMRQLEALRAENDALSARRATKRRASQIETNRARIQRLEWAMSRAGEEARAYRAGGYALGLFGHPLSEAQLSSGPVDEYPRDLIARSAVDGYFLGVRRTLRADPRYRALSISDRHVVDRRWKAYRQGFEREADAQKDATVAYEADPDAAERDRWWTPAKTAVTRAWYRLCRPWERLASDETAERAGQVDARWNFSPLSRAGQLLPPDPR